MELPLELPERSQDPERELASRELKQVLRTEIRHVPPLLRNAIILHDIQGLPMTAVAERLQISVPAAKSRLLRARTELRLRLRRQSVNLGTLSTLSRRPLTQSSDRSWRRETANVRGHVALARRVELGSTMKRKRGWRPYPRESLQTL